MGFGCEAWLASSLRLGGMQSGRKRSKEDLLQKMREISALLLLSISLIGGLAKSHILALPPLG